MRGLKVASPNDPAWREARYTGIGASEAAAACGVSEYETPLHIYMKKRGDLPESEETQSMRLGRRLEPIVVEEFAAVTGLEIGKYPVEMLRHEQHSFVLATPDAWLANQELLEAKTTTWMMAKKLGEEGSDAVPTEWLMQVQQQMAVTGAERAHVAVLLDGRTLKTFVVERHQALIERIIAIESELWERIRDGDPPEPTWSHARTPELIRQLHRGVDTGRVVELTDDARSAWSNYESLTKMAKEIDEQREAERSRVLAQIGDAEYGDLGDGFVIRRKLVEKTPYRVTPKPYIDIRKIKLER
jgi:putative phage-type endonuclease